jgi:hypothetical protein
MRPIFVALYVLFMVAVIVGVDVRFLRDQRGARRVSGTGSVRAQLPIRTGWSRSASSTAPVLPDLSARLTGGRLGGDLLAGLRSFYPLGVVLGLDDSPDLLAGVARRLADVLLDDTVFVRRSDSCG